MKTLVTAIQKGGQGKTAMTCHLAFDFFERQKLRVLVVDLDTQGNSSYTLEEFAVEDQTAAGLFRSEGVKLDVPDSGPCLILLQAASELADLEAQPLATVAPLLREGLAALAGSFDVCLIDTPPSLGVAMTSAVLAADYFMSPVEIEAYSMKGMEQLLTVVGHLREGNPKLEFLGMLPNKLELRKPRHQANLAALREAYPDFVMPVTIGVRDSIAEALGEKKPVWRIDKTAAREAKKEVRGVADFIFNRMGLAAA